MLFADDEEPLADLGRRVLGIHGFAVQSHTDPGAALAAFCAAPEGFDLVVADLTMPRMTGIGLAIAIRGVRPDVPIVLCTGLATNVTDRQAAASGVDAVLQKPIAPAELVRAVTGALARRAG